ncbi:hypothetical protein QW060_21075 [Myroides ceti]|uniref:Uncharacterized protein n=1 Tax=Paenimyroides ceti TaxID=395087 RepID=A0ABT8CZ25_9FLAO|nr:hypothetical protein [Paenimyroides ceti]MDN3709485.1 hypothetical protein [Paenimyroides ceti]
MKDIQNLNAVKLYPAGETENINVKYTDSAKIKAILVSKKCWIIQMRNILSTISRTKYT